MLTLTIHLADGMTMKISLRLATGTLLFLLFSTMAQAAAVLIPSPPAVNASSYILMDSVTGKVIVEHNADERLPPASLTKMMTAYIIERELDRGDFTLDDQVPISVKAWKTGGSRTFVKEGENVRLEDLLRGIIIQSGNDASVAMAEYLAGSTSAFVDIMNQQAKLLGMENTNFQSPTGLPRSNQYSSARDLAILAKHIIHDYPKNYPIYAEKQFTYAGIRQPNRNRLLWRNLGVDGLKTGYTERAGYCMVASAEQDGTRFIAVVMGTKSPEARAQEAQKLLSYGFRYYETDRLLKAGQELAEQRIWGGEADNVSIGTAEPMLVTLPRGGRSDVITNANIDTVIKAPVEAGQVIGEVVVTLNDVEVARQELVALTDVPEGGWFKRLMDAFLLFFIGYMGTDVA